MDATGIVTVLEDNARVYTTANGAGTSQLLAFNTQWKYGAITTDSQNRTWFNVGANQWVCETEVGAKISSAVQVSGICTVAASGATVQRSPNGSPSGKHLGANEQYRYSTKVTDAWGLVWFHVGYAEWVNTREVFDGNGPSTGSNIVSVAKSLLGYFTYAQVHGESYIGSIANPIRTGQTDCSGFVWLVLAKTNHSVPANMQWYTGSMEGDAKGAHNWLKQISTSEARAGDIIIMNLGAGAGNNGHTAILTGNWAGNNTPIIEMGGGIEGVNESTIGYAFSSLINGGASSVLARPV